MNVRLSLSLFCVCVVAGCVGDSMVDTLLRVTPALAGPPRQPQEVIPIVRRTLEARDFAEWRLKSEPTRLDKISFSNWYPGRNPKLSVTVTADRWPARIYILERWTGHRSHIHKAVIKELEAALEKEQFSIKKME